MTKHDAERELIASIEEAKDKIVALKEEKRRLIEERRALIDERRKLAEERRKLVGEFKEIRDRYRAMKEEFLKLKEERDSVKKEVENKREDLRIARQLAEKEGEVAKISLRRLQRRLEELEWKQMTSVMRPEEERRLVDEIARIESMIMKVRDARRHVISLLELQADFKSSLLRLKDLNQKLSKMWEEMRNHRTRLGELRAKIDEISKRIEEISKEIDAKSKRLDELTQEIDAMYAKYRDSLSKLREVKEAKRLGVELEILERKRKEVKEKAEKGIPLTLDEMRILYGELDI